MSKTLAIPPPQWDDGTWGVWEAGDIPAGVPRSKTKKTLKEAVAADPLDCNMTTPVGPGSVKNLSKARIQDMLDAYKKINEQLGKVSIPGKLSATPEPREKLWPHICPACGGRTLELFSSTEHELTGTKYCPQPEKKKTRY